MTREEEIQKEIEKTKRFIKDGINSSEHRIMIDQINLWEAELKGIQETEARILRIIKEVVRGEKTSIDMLRKELTKKIKDKKE